MEETISRVKFTMMRKVRNVFAVLRKVKDVRPRVSHSSLLKSALILLILVIAFGIRLLPVRWGYYMSEFDPYYQYRQTKYIVENGLLGENGWIAWHDYLSWYPMGNEIRYHSYPGLPVTAAALYMVLNTLGVQLVSTPSLDSLLSDPVYILCVVFPVIMGTLTCLVIYFLGRDLGGEAVGLFAALFLALDSAYIDRTSLGFFDDESVGIFSMLLFVLFFVRSIDKNRSQKTGSLYATAAGLSLGYLCATWGASRYPIAMTALFAFVLLIIRRYSFRLLLSYGLTFFLSLSIAASIPYLGSKFPLDYIGARSFLFGIEILPVYGVLYLLCIAEIIRRTGTKGKKVAYLLGSVALLVAVVVVFWSQGFFGGLETKFMSLLNPFVRFENPIIESVAEHRPSAWGTFYYNWGIGIFFLPVGLFFATMMATNLSLFMIIYSLTSVYFASSMIRINIIMSPAISLLWALAIVRISKPFILALREASPRAKQKMRFRRVLGKETALGILAMMFVLFTLTYVIGTDFVAGPYAQGARVYNQAYAPTTIASAAMSAKPSDTARDWIDTLIWMRENLPPSPRKPGEPGTVVASWWDYGYWISAVANRTTLADNGTWNWTQIERIGLMFMSNETRALEILKKYDVTHVVVFTTVRVGQDSEGYLVILPAMAGGDEGKWEWMAKIPGLDPDPFGNLTLGWDWVDYSGDGSAQWDERLTNEQGQNTTLYKLMNYGAETTVYGYSYSVQLEYFEEVHFSQIRGGPQYAPGTSYIPIVCVYKVNYPTE